MSNERAPRKRWKGIAAGTSVALLIFWLAGSGVAAWRLTGRPRPRSAESLEILSTPQKEEHRLLTADGLLLGAWLVRSASPRPSVLLLHGNGASRSSFAALMTFLAEQGCAALAVSLRAHGDSAGDLNDFGWSSRSDVVRAVEFLEAERPGRRIVVVGESLGAAAALFAARPCAGRVQGYLLAAPYGDLKTAVWNRCQSHLVPPLSQAAYGGLILWAPAFLPVPSHQIRPADHLADIPANVPVTLFASAQDRYARFEEIRSMAASLGSRARLVRVPDGSHGRFLSLHEAEYHQAILELVRQVEAAP